MLYSQIILLIPHFFVKFSLFSVGIFSKCPLLPCVREIKFWPCETSSIHTKRNRKQYCTVKLTKSRFLSKKRENCGWQFEAIFCISGVWYVGWWNFITIVCVIQVGNNRNDHFWYFLGVGVRLIEVSA